MKDQPGDSWLEKVANPFVPTLSPAFELGSQVEEMLDNSHDSHMTSLLVVGGLVVVRLLLSTNS